jgi:hypothetical protein
MLRYRMLRTRIIGPFAFGAGNCFSGVGLYNPPNPHAETDFREPKT